MGFLVDDEDTALMWRGLILAKALEQFLIDVQLGRPRLPAHRHAARHRRHPDGAGAPAAAGRDARGDHAGARRAEGRGARRRHGAPLVPEGARRRREHDASSSRPTARATRSSERAAAGASPRLTGAPLVGAVPIEPRGVEGGDAGTPVVLAHPELPAARARSTESRRRIVDELLPPVEMAGCTARMFELVDKLAPAAEPGVVHLARAGSPVRAAQAQIR